MDHAGRFDGAAVDDAGATMPGAEPLSTLGVIAPALLLAACGGGSGGGSESVAGAPVASVPASTPTPTPITVVVSKPTEAQASRFLHQATMGATRTTIAEVIDKGYEKWIVEQIAMPRAVKHWDWLVANGYNAAANMNNIAGYDPSVWRQIITEPDQLRQRVGTALLDILVVGVDGINTNWRQFAAAAYLDILLDHAFGNFRALLDAVTTNAAMASFLTFLNGRKANPRTGAMPDENYARELMQLFTLGLHQLNMDGTVKTSGGVPLETYTQTDVTGLAAVFTGFVPATTDSATPDRLRAPIVMDARFNEGGATSFLGTGTTGGGMAAVKTALDAIFAHPNVPPFVSSQLIQRLVTSNPSPAYVQRVATVFADNGKGVSGDLAATVRAILIDAEARSEAALTTADAGRLRAPVLRFTAWARAFGATSPSNAWGIGDTSNPATRLGQTIGHAPSVFNFFRPGYVPPATSLASSDMVAPEFQITSEQSVIGYVNFMYSVVANGIGDVKADYAAIQAKAGDAQALVDEVNLLLAAGQLSPATVAAIRAAVESVSPTAANGPINRVGVAILLTLACPEFLTIR